MPAPVVMAGGSPARRSRLPGDAQTARGVAARRPRGSGSLVPGPVASGSAGDALPDFVEVPAGPFIMGAESDRDAWHSTTNAGRPPPARARSICPRSSSPAPKSPWGSSPRSPRREVDGLSSRCRGHPRIPSTFVTWPEALAYCRWLETTLAASAGVPGAVKIDCNPAGAFGSPPKRSGRRRHAGTTGAGIRGVRSRGGIARTSTASA